MVWAGIRFVRPEISGMNIASAVKSEEARIIQQPVSQTRERSAGFQSRKDIRVVSVPRAQEQRARFDHGLCIVAAIAGQLVGEHQRPPGSCSYLEDTPGKKSGKKNMLHFNDSM